MSEDMPAAQFAALLRQLKERSGLSYGVLAGRLHMSTSTLHRYCNGDAVPADYAPVERLARLCKAGPGELVELHRRWVLADAARGRKPSASAGGKAPASPSVPAGEPVRPGEPARTGEPAAGAGVRGRDDVSQPSAGRSTPGWAEPEDPQAETRETEKEHRETEKEHRAAGLPETATGETETRQDGTPQVTGPGKPSAGTRTGRTRTAVLAGIAVAAVLGGITLALGLPDGGAGSGGDRNHPVGSTTVGAAGAGGNKDAVTSPSASASATASVSPSASPSAKARETPRTPATASATPTGDRDGSAVPLTVRTEPYAWQNPCSQRYLINRPASEVKPPPEEPDATAWVSSFGAVSSEEQYVRLTVQGTGDETVVVEGLSVRVAGRRSPLAWNDFAMGYPGVGCGGDVPTRSFTVALDAARPRVTPEAGQRDFPFSVSESDPEVYHVTADASAYDVSWYLELKWSSGSRSGTLTVDDKGRPFRTSGNNGRPAYEFPLGGEEWVPEGTTR